MIESSETSKKTKTQPISSNTANTKNKKPHYHITATHEQASNTKNQFSKFPPLNSIDECDSTNTIIVGTN